MVNTKLSILTSASPLVGTEIFYADTGAADVKVTSQQIKDFSINTPFAIGANVILSTADVKVGNSTVNAFVNSSLIKVANTLGVANLTPFSLVVGTSVINTTTYAIGANVTLDTTDLQIGNSVANLFANSIIVSIANSSSAANLQPTQLVVGANVSLDTTDLQIGNSVANLFVNSTAIKIANTTSNTVLDPVNMFQGNSIANTNSNSISFKIANATSNLVLSPVNLFSGNSIANLNANSILVKVANATSTANLTPLDLTIGTSVVNSTAVKVANTGLITNTTAAVNGATYITGGILLQWGWVSATSTGVQATFPVAFPTALYSATVTQVNATPLANSWISISSSNTTQITVKTGNATATNCSWIAIGK